MTSLRRWSKDQQKARQVEGRIKGNIPRWGEVGRVGIQTGHWLSALLELSNRAGDQHERVREKKGQRILQATVKTLMR